MGSVLHAICFNAMAPNTHFLVTTFFPFFHFCEVLVDLNDPPLDGPLKLELLNDVIPLKQS